MNTDISFWKLMVLPSILVLIFTYWYNHTVSFSGRVVDTSGNIMPYVRYAEAVGDMSKTIGSVEESGVFTVENIRSPHICILFYYEIPIKKDIYRFDLLTKCGDIIPFKDKNVSDVIINLETAFDSTPSKAIKSLQSSGVLTVYDQYQHKKYITFPKKIK